MAAAYERANRSEAEWKAQLTPLQYQVLCLKGTEPAGSGEYNVHFAASGTYVCSGCHAPLYTADKKFDSGCGWPAFYDVLPHAIKVAGIVLTLFLGGFLAIDSVAVKIQCLTILVVTGSSVSRVAGAGSLGSIGSHLGHVICGEGYKMPTDERHCINSVAIVFHDDIVAAEPSA